MSESEAGRRYGGQRGNRLVYGQIVEVNNIRNEAGRIQTTVTADFEFAGEVTKRATLHLKSVQVPEVNGPDLAPPD